MDRNDRLAERLEAQRTRMRALAYRMLAPLSEADDAVQEDSLHMGWSEKRRGESGVSSSVPRKHGVCVATEQRVVIGEIVSSIIAESERRPTAERRRWATRTLITAVGASPFAAAPYHRSCLYASRVSRVKMNVLTTKATV